MAQTNDATCRYLQNSSFRRLLVAERAGPPAHLQLVLEMAVLRGRKGERERGKMVAYVVALCLF